MIKIVRYFLFFVCVVQLLFAVAFFLQLPFAVNLRPFPGTAAYFAYGLLRPSWVNSAGQLVGFLAYDVVLIVPFLTRLPTTPAEFRVGLTIYTAVVIYSGLLAIYYLFIH